ncbi:hypothetical protein [Mycobacterium sp.]|uniref:hypothetical protein n=1 Tax=Mycobacterium sp. TaxID=1785 RepID=UPI002B76C8BA|nr:hypothetical protein [Mycobacterium sp.]HTQ16882.1 hypothetical protein [Mycobacterium sp.]
MSHRQVYIGVVGVLLAAFGLAAMFYPIHLGLYDTYGIKVSCGNGFNSTLSQASQTEGHDVAGQCGSALMVRRAWAISAMVLGWLLVTWFLASWVHNDHSKDEDAEPAHYVPHPEIARHF